MRVITLALVGDTMLGRGVAAVLGRQAPESLVSGEVAALAAGADITLLNLECVISERGQRWPRKGKAFFFRAPPAAVAALRILGADCVTCANNHALDFGAVALLDTLSYLAAAGVLHVGAGRTLAEAQAPAVLDVDGFRVGVLGFTDHPADFAATVDGPGVAYVDLKRGLVGGLPEWVATAVDDLRERCDAVIVTPHWGPNMTARPLPYIRAAAHDLLAAGATLVAGHSAHVFHGIHRQGGQAVLFDLGDFLDDYATDPALRNDLGVLWRVSLDRSGVRDIEAVPLVLEYAYTRLATSAEIAAGPWSARLCG